MYSIRERTCRIPKVCFQCQAIADVKTITSGTRRSVNFRCAGLLRGERVCQQVRWGGSSFFNADWKATIRARFRGDDLTQAAAEDHFTAGDLNIDHFAVFGPMPPMLLGCVVPSRAKGFSKQRNSFVGGRMSRMSFRETPPVNRHSAAPRPNLPPKSERLYVTNLHRYVEGLKVPDLQVGDQDGRLSDKPIIGNQHRCHRSSPEITRRGKGSEWICPLVPHSIKCCAM